MRKFRFTLESVRSLREEREARAMRVLADRIREHAAAAQAAQASDARYRRAADAMRMSSARAALLAQANHDRDAARLAADQAQLALSERSFGVTSARSDVAEARQAVEMLSRFEERQRLAHRQAVAAELERDAADVIEMRSARAAAASQRRRSR
jgi:hypothetical protein